MRKYIVLALMAISVPATAFDASTLYQSCVNRDSLVNVWVIGASNALSAYRVETCRTPDVKVYELRDRFCKFLSDRPDLWDIHSGYLLKLASESTWEC